MLGYKYFTEQETQTARKQCADYYGLPKSPEDVTQFWVDYQEGDGFWYIAYDETIEVVLGEPIEFEINMEE